MLRKIVSFLLSLVVILSLLTGQAPVSKAVGNTPIPSLNIGITEPAAFNAPDYNPSLTGIYIDGVKSCYLADQENDVGKNDVYWLDFTDDSSMYVDSDVFQVGHQYKVIVYVTPKDGFEFTEASTATINGTKSAECELYEDQLKVTYVFPAVGAVQTIDSVSLTFEDFAVGEYVDYYPVYPSDAHYKNYYDEVEAETELRWWDLTRNKLLEEYTMTRYQSGRVYKVAVMLHADKGYQFTDKTTGKINGNKAVCEINYNSFGKSYLLVTYIFRDFAPLISTQPKAVAVKEGQTATFTVTASGSGLKYQWQYRKPGESSWQKVSNNGTSATYSLKAQARHNGYTYRVKITDSFGNVYSDTAKLTVRPTIVTQPSAVGVKEGSKASFTVAASGTGLTYQWQYKKPGASTWTNVSKNGTSAIYSLTAAARHNGYTYRCKVTNSGGGYVYSGSAKLTVRPGITTQPKSVSVTAGKKASFTVVASGTGLTYQWQYKKPGSSTWTNVSANGTSATYSLTTAARHNGYVYRCKVTNSGGGYVYSSSAKLTVK